MENVTSDQVKQLQAEGKKRMSAKAFLAGNRITDWELL